MDNGNNENNMNKGNNAIICILFNRVKGGGSSLKGFLIFLIILALLSFFPNRCSALPVWPVTEDPNGNSVDTDIIGFEDADGKEFGSTFGSEVIEYEIGIDEWSEFPQRLKTRVNTSQPYPHTVNIRFNANPTTDSWNLSLGIQTIEPSGQYLGIFFDGHPIHPLGGEWIQQEVNFRQYDFWLGSIAQGEHTITIRNETDWDSTYGTFFDYCKLVPAARETILIPDHHQNISDGIRNSAPGDTIIVKRGINGIYQDGNAIILKSGTVLKSGREEDPNEIDPNGIIIDGQGKETVIYGAYQAQVKGFTIKNGGSGIFVSHDSMNISNNIIHACARGILLTGQDLAFINNSIARTDCGIYVRKPADANSPIPSLTFKNNIMSDSNYPLYVYTDTNSEVGIDPALVHQVVHDYSFNLISTRFPSNSGLSGFGTHNVYSDPYFVDPNQGDYHLKTYSPCIDAGDPNSDFSLEPEPNGGRINLGAFGNTLQAQKTMDSDMDGILDFIEGPGDINQDGSPDWLDSNTIVFATSTGEGFDTETGQGRIGFSLKADPNAPISLKNVTALDRNDPNISNLSPPRLNFRYGFWKLEITGMDSESGVEIGILLPEDPYFDFQEYYLYDPEKGWEMIPTKKEPLRSMIFIYLSYESDENKNLLKDGSVSHVGGIAVPFPLSLGERYEFKECFISNL